MMQVATRRQFRNNLHLIEKLAVIAYKFLRKRWWNMLKWLFDPTVFLKQMAIICVMQFSYRTYLTLSRKSYSVMSRFTNKKLHKAYLKLEAAKTYKEYVHFAQKLDEVCPRLQKWKGDDTPLIDRAAIESRMYRYNTEVKDEEETYNLMFELRTGLLRRHFGIASPKLYRGFSSQTKTILEKYVKSVLAALSRCAKSPLISVSDKLSFLHDTRRSFGRTALCLSGGCSLGAYHFGIVKGLWEAECLPTVVTGSSAGAICAAWLGVQTDEDLRNWSKKTFSEDGLFNLFEFYPQEKGDESEWETRARRIVQGDGFFDSDAIKNLTQAYIKDITFLEAYEKTGRIVNIVVSSDQGIPFLTNFLTSPHVMIWSAVCASVAVPGVFKPVQMYTKNRLGETGIYDRAGTKWRDGSFTNDLPYKRLSELFNVNHFIVSQVSPHRTFFGPLPENAGFFGKTFNFLTVQTSAVVEAFERILPYRFSPLALLTQKGVGDITIYPTESMVSSLLAVLKVLWNPDVENYIKISEQQVWKLSTRIRINCCVEILMDKLITMLENETLGQVQEFPDEVELNNMMGSGDKYTGSQTPVGRTSSMLEMFAHARIGSSRRLFDSASDLLTSRRPNFPISQSAQHSQEFQSYTSDGSSPRSPSSILKPRYQNPKK